MKRGLKTPVAVLLGLLLAAGLVACGGGGDSDSSSAETTSRGTEHEDSGGGSEQFRVAGGDNTIQEFGEEASDAEFEAVATALHGYLDARADRDWETVCGYMSRELAESMEALAAKSEKVDGTSCAAAQEALSIAVPNANREKAAEADIGSVRVEGEDAFAIYHGDKGVSFAMPMASEGGEWKVASLSATEFR